ncbi:hypothetical protein IW140_002673 [Coemansia sp. RSA 1813]|nr:hypothetical protein EV178_000252 [Coemansia sp. RSA 1646]KAJ1767347.1 hypothetical protein LPJ74_005421 [Coemansia sp. RSA 1843]KAJ2090441.1 hypothetical protein IW138_002652 [Coemansia sp. RSA 986]KAJ2215408.1 hypothetical protein EV179_002192 [Coemansia sp. RSA 487]KAJ2569997.1 hypothetical protein IW140_002673 [Coemansia sp. RSA 1813]
MKREGSAEEGSTLPSVSKSPSPSSEDHRHTLSKAKKWFLYAADWITVIVVAAISQLILIPWPHSQNFIVSDPAIQQEYHNDRKNIDRISIVLSTTVPTVIVMVWLGWFSRPLNEMHRVILGLATALSFCTLFTSIFRQISNVFSSDFISLCKPTQEAFENSVRFGTPISYSDCTNRDIHGQLHEYPIPSITISSCAAGYLSLFASVQLGLRLHPQVIYQLRQVVPAHRLQNSLHGQTLISFVCLIPIGAGMAFPAAESRYHGGGHGWSYAFSIILGYIFALWAHLLYCGDMSVALRAFVA